MRTGDENTNCQPAEGHQGFAENRSALALQGSGQAAEPGWLDCIGDAIIAVDQGWRVVYANSSTARLFRLPAAEATGMALWDIVPGLRTACEADLRRVMQQRLEARVEFFHDETGRWFDASAYPAPGGIITQWRDITMRKATHAELLEMTHPKREALALLDALFPEPLKIVLYRVAQEAMTNAAKHSGGETIGVRLRAEGGFIKLEVEDNGSGFDLQAAAERAGFFGGHGLQSMRQRVEICGGAFELKSEAGKGTLIRARLPADPRL
jgi:PAS domain S-box-containing protein